jgi:hypothetical protein
MLQAAAAYPLALSYLIALPCRSYGPRDAAIDVRRLQRWDVRDVQRSAYNMRFCGLSFRFLTA